MSETSSIVAQEQEAAIFAVREAEKGNPQYLMAELRRFRDAAGGRELSEVVRIWLVNLLEVGSGSEWKAALTRRRSGRPKSSAGTHATEERLHRLVTELRGQRASEPGERQWLADLFDEKGTSDVRLSIRRRRRGKPVLLSRRIVEAGYHVAVRIEGNSKLEFLLADAREKFRVSRSGLLRHLHNRWPELSKAFRRAKSAAKKR
jgi:hypothetical protein